MAQPTRAQRFLQKAEAALIAAIEIYNKPDFRYREETFSILALNGWELLLKARLLAAHASDEKCLYVYETRTGRKGRPTKKRYRKRNRSGNFQTLGFGATIVALEKQGVTLAPGVQRNLDALIEVRDNAVHFVAAGPLLSKQVFEFGTAAVANFLRLSRDWFQHDLSRYHLYLMPLGFVSPPANADSVVVGSDEANVVQYLASLAGASEVKDDDPYQVALTLNIKMKRSSTADGIKVAITDDPDAPKVFVKEEDFRQRYPWDYGQLTAKLRKRYSDFKAAQQYHDIRKPLMREAKFCMSRFLDPGNPRSAKKDFFSPTILNEFDKRYSRRGAPRDTS